MSLRRKILISNALMVIVPIALTISLCACYIGFGGAGVTALSQQGKDDYLGRSQNIVSTLEAGLSNMHWDLVSFEDDSGAKRTLIPNTAALDELESLGFHLQVESAGDVLFSNADALDARAIEATRANSEGSIAWYESRLVIQDSLVINGLPSQLIAVYDETRADEGAIASLVLPFVFTPSTLALFIAFAIASIALTAFVLTRWLNRSVVEPLDELRSAAERVQEGNLDRRIDYPKQDEFAEVVDAFDGMRKRLKEAEAENAHFEEERQELLRGISHDLRSPLTSIVGYASGIKDGIADTDEKRQRYCDAILTRASDLERMVESLTVLTCHEGAETLHTVRVSAYALIKETVDAKGAWLESNDVIVSVCDDSQGAEIMIDENEMRRVIDNLLVNTVKYRQRSDSHVTVDVSRDGRFACIRYADDGPGVPEQHIGHIFESFYRADESRTKQGEGSGLGLAIVKRIVEAHGGDVLAQNDNGLVITMKLPLAEGDA